MISALRRTTAALLPVVLVAGVVAAVLHDGDAQPHAAQARLTVDGVAAVVRADGTEEELRDDDATVDFGDTVEVRAGSAVLELAGGATYELGHHAGTGSAVVVDAVPRVTAGAVLVAAGFPARVQVGGASLSARGALRVDAGTESAASYGGGATVAGAGDVTELAALRQLVLVPGAQPEPVTFDGADPWDRRFLGEAIAFGERLESLARGYTSDLPPGGGRSADFFRSVVPALDEEPELGDDLLDPARPPGETLVGAAIAVQGRQGSFRDRWAAIFAFRGSGAAWGLVALDQGVSSAPVLQTIEVAIGSSPTPTGTAPTGATGGLPTSTAGGAGPTTTPPPTTTTTAPPPEPEPEPEPSTGGLLDPDPDPDPTGGLLDPLLGDLLRLR